MWKHLSFFTAVLVALAAGGMGLTGDAAEQKPDKRIVADLKDGMRIVGLPLKETLCWGYHIPYMLAGLLDKHPLQAMQWMASPARDDCVKFYQQITYEG